MTARQRLEQAIARQNTDTLKQVACTLADAAGKDAETALAFVLAELERREIERVSA